MISTALLASMNLLEMGLTSLPNLWSTNQGQDGNMGSTLTGKTKRKPTKTQSLNFR
jgi:hypothetical protein